MEDDECPGRHFEWYETLWWFGHGGCVENVEARSIIGDIAHETLAQR